RAAEKVVEGSGLPWTTLRATQISDLMLMVARQMSKLPIVPLPSGFQVQPVEADEVAARLVELTLGEPAGLVPDMGGPRVYAAADLLRGYLRATKRRRPIAPVWLPGKAARLFRAGANLAPEQAVGHRTWEEFLADRLGHLWR
ncbi:MAG: NAD-dependent epimerase/dehydratase family protein, partial [Rubrobacter sp.]|nr:NAD-dependent epimerase/dehydratase family protein [Rubrobacter sp.]